MRPCVYEVQWCVRVVRSERKDYVCPLPVLEDLIARCPEPKTVTLIPGADHFFLGREAEVAEAIVTFVTQ